ncbi:hypothetical protein SNN69_001483 [Cronobacter sakazakii]|nr:hypothetical protein [Cronobacter sakazakii]
MDKSREQFLDWFSKEYEEVNNSTELSAQVIKMIASAAWQASRAAVEIDASAEPFYPMPINNCPTDHYHYGRESVISKVRAAGLKVKGE